MERAVDTACEAADGHEGDDDLDGDGDQEPREAGEQPGPDTGPGDPWWLVTTGVTRGGGVHNAAQTRVTLRLHPVLINGQQRREPGALK